MCVKVERDLGYRHEYMSGCVFMSDPEEETKGGGVPCLTFLPNCPETVSFIEQAHRLSLEGRTAPGISLSLHLSSNKVGLINICIYALHFTRELESLWLYCALSLQP